MASVRITLVAAAVYPLLGIPAIGAPPANSEDVRGFVDRVAAQTKAVQNIVASYTQSMYFEETPGTPVPGEKADVATGFWAKREDGAFVNRMTRKTASGEKQTVSLVQRGRLYYYEQESPGSGVGQIRNAPETVPGMLYDAPEAFVLPWTWVDAPWFGRKFAKEYSRAEEKRDNRTMTRVKWAFGYDEVSVLIDTERNLMPVEILKYPKGGSGNPWELMLRVTGAKLHNGIWFPTMVEKRWLRSPDGESRGKYGVWTMAIDAASLNCPPDSALFGSPWPQGTPILDYTADSPAATTRPSAAQGRKDPADQHRIRELRTQRRDVLRRLAAIAEARFQQGLPPVDEMAKDVMELQKAELELCTTPEERMRVREETVKKSREWEQRLAARQKAGWADEPAVGRARARTLQAEIELEQEKLLSASNTASRTGK